MKHSDTQIRALLAPLALGLIGAAQAQFTLVDDFESYTAGVNGNTTTPPWVQGFPAGGANAATTVIGPDDAAGQALRYTHAGSGGQINYSNVGTIAAEGAVGTIFFQAYLDATGSDTLFAFGRSGLAAYGDLAVLFRVPSDLIVEVHNGAYANTATTLAADTLYNFWVVIDNAANTATLYYSAGNSQATPISIQAGFAFRNATAGDISTFYLGTNGGSTGFIDNIYIDATGSNLANPAFTDTDGDGLDDAWELTHGLDPDDDGTTGESSPGAKDGPNGALGDPDEDELSNLGEYQAGTDPQEPDTDGDTLTDGEEIAGTSNAFASGTPTDPLLADSDGDGANDFEENGSLNTAFSNEPTDPNVADTDGDGMDDAYELLCNTSGSALDPNDDGSGDPTQAPTGDRDGDELTNLEEYQAFPQTRADLADTDGDGLSDKVEDSFGSWGDVEATGTDPTNPDTDGDGLLDGEENFDLSTFNGGPGFPGQGVTPTNSDPNLADTDFDGFFDGYEVEQGTDPDDAADFPTQPEGFQLVEDFEGTGMVIGQTFNGVNGWVAQISDAAVVEDEPIAGGDQIGSFVRPTGQAPSSLYRSIANLGYQVLEGNTGTLFMQLYVPIGGVDNSFGFSDVSAPGFDFGAYEAQLVMAGAANELRVRDAGAFRVRGTHRVGEWMNVWIVADNGTDTLRVFVQSPAAQSGQVEITDDFGTDAYNFRNGTLEALSTLYFAHNGGTELPVLFDNVYVDPGASNLTTPAAAKPVLVTGAPMITDVFFESGDLKIRFTPGGTGFTLTSSNDLVSPFVEETNATYDGIDTFTVPASALAPERDFFRVEEP